MMVTHQRLPNVTMNLHHANFKLHTQTACHKIIYYCKHANNTKLCLGFCTWSRTTRYISKSCFAPL